MSDRTWRDESLCKGKHLDFWFPPLESSTLTPFFAVAKVVCDRCPVWEDCLNDGKDEDWGMWGGLTPHERRSMNSYGGAHIKPHGTITRFRQGCKCSECRFAATRPLKDVDLSVIPEWGEESVNVRLVREALSK